MKPQELRALADGELQTTALEIERAIEVVEDDIDQLSGIRASASMEASRSACSC